MYEAGGGLVGYAQITNNNQENIKNDDDTFSGVHELPNTKPEDEDCTFKLRRNAQQNYRNNDSYCTC